MKVLRWLDQYLEEALLLIMLCAMTLVMGVQVAARYVLGSSLSWSEEITRFLFIVSGFISASFCIKKGASVKIDQLVGMLPGKGVHIFRLISYSVQLVFFAYLIPFAWKYVAAGMESGQRSPACGIPMYIIQSFTVISFVLCVIRLIQKWLYRLQIILGVSLGIVSVLPGVFDSSFTASASYVIRSMFGGLDSFPLLAVPMFILSGIIMARGGISKRLFDLFAYFIGKRTAGLPCAAVVTCLFYGAISGSGIATVAAVGSMTIPLLVHLGYDKKFCTALVAVAGSLGVIIPPSIPFIMYGMASGVSVSDIFIAGIIPGILIGVLLMVYAVYYCRKNGEDKEKINEEIDRETPGKRPVEGVQEQLFCSPLTGDHPGMHLLRRGVPHGGGGHLRVLLPDHQPVCVQVTAVERAVRSLFRGGEDLCAHPLHPGSVHRFFQGADPDAGASDHQHVDTGQLCGK